MSDLWVAITCLPWLVPLGFFAFIYVEWSGRGRGEENLHTRLFGEERVRSAFSDDSVFRRRADDD
jgi:hypothetical protein